MTHDPKAQLEKDERDLMQKAITSIKQITANRPCIVLVGFDAPHGMKVCSVSNLTQQEQVEMMQLMVEGFMPVPDGLTLN